MKVLNEHFDVLARKTRVTTFNNSHFSQKQQCKRKYIFKTTKKKKKEKKSQIRQQRCDARSKAKLRINLSEVKPTKFGFPALTNIVIQQQISVRVDSMIRKLCLCKY